MCLVDNSGILVGFPDGNSNVPTGFSSLFVITKGSELVIEQVSETPNFTVTSGGDYTIHTFVYPSGLDLAIVELGVTTGFDVFGLITEGGIAVCASSDVAGAPVFVEEESCTANAGTISSNYFISCLHDGAATITATQN